MKSQFNKEFKLIVIGSSFGGLKVIESLIPQLNAAHLPIVIVQHIKEYPDNLISTHLGHLSNIIIKEAVQNEQIANNTVYIAPSGYHLLIEFDKTFSLSVNAPVNFSRPSIDVLFESASDVYREQLIGVILSGANADGAHGLSVIRARHGITIVQDPASADASSMPNAAIEAGAVDYVLEPKRLVQFLVDLA